MKGNLLLNPLPTKNLLMKNHLNFAAENNRNLKNGS